jgi:AraC-like DNA-binding protein
MFDEIDRGPLPRQLIADQIGALLVLATGFHEPAPSRHRGHLVRRILRRIEADYSDTELTSDSVAQDLGISQRYLQALLASTGTRFVLELNAVRLDRASNLLRDPRAAGLSLGEVAYRCGFLDPGYFARLFRRRLGVAPSQWRAMRPKP